MPGHRMKPLCFHAYSATQCMVVLLQLVPAFVAIICLAAQTPTGCLAQQGLGALVLHAVLGL